MTNPTGDDQLVFLNLPFPVLLLDDGLNVTNLNPAAGQWIRTLASMGVSAQRDDWTENEEYSSASVSLLFSLFFSDWLHECRTFMASGEPEKKMEKRIRGMRETRVYMVRLVRLRDPGSQTCRLMMILNDVTPFTRAKEALEASEAKFSTAFRESPVWVVLSSLADGRYIEVNDTFLKETGYLHDEVIGRSSLDLGTWVDPEDRRRVVDEIRSRGMVRNLEVRRRTKDGRILTMLFSGERLLMDHEDHLLSVSLDITERKKTEEALLAEKDRFRVLTEKSPLGISIIGSDGRYKYLNPKFTSIFGFRLEDIPSGRDWFKKAFPHPGTRRKVIAEWKQDLEEIGPLQARPRIYSVRCKDSREKVIHFWPVAMGSGDQFVIYEDITERVTAEKELKLKEEQLFQARKMEALGTMISGIAHDFNNLLQTISGYVELMKRLAKQRSKLFIYLKEATRTIDRASELVRRLLAFSRKVSIERSPVDLNREIRQTVRTLKRTFPKNVTFRLELARDLTMAYVDSREFEQILFNLASNARDVLPDGGRIRIKTENVIVEGDGDQDLPGLLPGPHLLVTFADSGPGMGKEVLEHVFEPFFTTKEVGQGTGLGLSTVYGLVKAHGGEIFCRSQLGQGTQFFIYLPAASGDQPAQHPKVRNLEVRNGTETVLVVDDEPSIRETAREILSEFGYTVWTADSGEGALDLVGSKAGRVDLVILDLGMPGMGGLACLKALMKMAPDIRVLVASGYASAAHSRMALDQGAKAFLSKPYKLDRLVAAVREILDQPPSGRYEPGDGPKVPLTVES